MLVNLVDISLQSLLICLRVGCCLLHVPRLNEDAIGYLQFPFKYCQHSPYSSAAKSHAAGRSAPFSCCNTVVILTGVYYCNWILSKFCILRFQTAGNSSNVLFKLMYCPANLQANDTLNRGEMLKWKTQYPISKQELHIITNVNILNDVVRLNGPTSSKVRNAAMQQLQHTAQLLWCIHKISI